MTRINEILQRAGERGSAMGLPYAGALTPDEAYELSKEIPAAVLVDVRSQAEWQFVGIVPDAVRIELRSFPGMVPNPHFTNQLTQQVDKEALVMFFCRSGARSDEASRLATAEGYATVYNVLEGFEGDKDAEQHRGRLNGWKGRGLPWIQG